MEKKPIAAAFSAKRQGGGTAKFAKKVLFIGISAKSVVLPAFLMYNISIKYIGLTLWVDKELRTLVGL